MTDHAEYERLFRDWPELRPKSDELGNGGFLRHADGWCWMFPDDRSRFYEDDRTGLAICRDHIREVLHGMGWAMHTYPPGWVGKEERFYEITALNNGRHLTTVNDSFDDALIALARAVMEREKEKSNA